MPEQPQATPRFPVGETYITPAAEFAIEAVNQTPQAYMARHHGGDWGTVPPEDAAANEEALQIGARLLSAYTLPDGVSIWIITEADRASTTILLPSEY